jgi:hypothetical protein
MEVFVKVAGSKLIIAPGTGAISALTSLTAILNSKLVSSTSIRIFFSPNSSKV